MPLAGGTERTVTRRQIQLRSLAVVAVATAVATVGGLTVAYQLTLEGRQAQLVELARSQSRLMEAVGKFDAFFSGGAEGASLAATLSQVREAHRKFTGFGATGEIMLAHLVDGQIVFLLPARRGERRIPAAVPFDADRAEPMRRALSRESGLIEDLDYSGVEVLAAYEYLPFLELGLVAKIDRAEIQAPFLRAGYIASGIALVAILVALILNARTVNPLIDSVTQSEQRIRTLMESTPDGMVIVDAGGMIRMVNVQAESLFRYSRNELLGQPVERLVPDAARTEHAARRQSHRPGERTRQMGAGLDLSGRRKDGSEFPVEISLSPIRDGEQRQVLAVVRDMTERREAERAVRESQAFLQAVIDNSTALIYAKDLEGRYLLTNRAWADILGLATGAVGKTDYDLFPRELADIYVANDRAVLESGESASTEENAAIRGEMCTFLSVKFPILDTEGQPVAVCGISTDITDRKREEIRGRAMASFRQAVWSLDTNSRLEEVLHALEASLEELQIRHRVVAVNLIDHGGDAPSVRFHALVEGDTWSQGEMSAEAAAVIAEIWRRGEVANRPDLAAGDALAASDGSAEGTGFLEAYRRRAVIDVPFSQGTLALNSDKPHAFDVHLDSLRSLARVLGEALTRLEDLRALRERTEQAEVARRAADEANASKSIFLANMSHEIRTPMNAILGFAEILSGMVRDSQQRHYLTTIQTSGKALLGLINDILDLSKVEAGKLELVYAAVDAGQVFRDMEYIFAQKVGEKGITFEVTVDERIPKALVLDETRLRQILVNLIGNAVKFTEVGGVRLTLMNNSAAVAAGSRIDLVFEVSDSGVGIPPDQQDKIFGAFEQTKGQSFTKFGGTGLGLAITRRLIEMMGGTVSVSSESGAGSTFTVTLPGVEVAAVEELISHDDGPDISTLIFAPAQVLIVDDVDTNRQLVKAYLGDYNFDLLEATNGEEGVEQARRYHPDLVIMDMRMPVMSGYEAARILKQEAATAHIPILALTASVMAHHEEQVREICDGYLRKPASKAQLVNEIARFLAHSRRAEPSLEAREAAGLPVSPGDAAGPAPAQIVDALESARAAWQVLVDTLTITDIEEFARKMQALAAQHSWAPLSEWGQRLEKQASTFDLTALPATLAEYEQLLHQAREGT